jgi:RNA polymerase sigma factor (sigma-70 family)
MQTPQTPMGALPARDDGSYASLRRLLAAEAAAQVPPGAGIEAGDLEQAVWLRLLEGGTPFRQLPEPGRWLRDAVRAEAREAARRVHGEHPYDDEDRCGPADPYDRGVEERVLAAEQRRALRAAVRLLPGRCPQLLTALMSSSDPTYQEISHELGISQGSVGPLRSRCFGCLRTILDSRVGTPVGWGNAR